MIEFQNSVVRYSFVCHITDIKIAWINPQKIIVTSHREIARVS